MHGPAQQPAGQLARVRERLEQQRAVPRQADLQVADARDQAARGRLALRGRGRVARLQLVVREAAAHALSNHLRQRLRGPAPHRVSLGPDTFHDSTARLQLVVRETAAHALGDHLRQRLRRRTACGLCSGPDSFAAALTATRASSRAARHAGARRQRRSGGQCAARSGAVWRVPGSARAAGWPPPISAPPQSGPPRARRAGQGARRGRCCTPQTDTLHTCSWPRPHRCDGPWPHSAPRLQAVSAGAARARMHATRPSSQQRVSASDASSAASRRPGSQPWSTTTTCAPAADALSARAAPGRAPPGARAGPAGSPYLTLECVCRIAWDGLSARGAPGAHAHAAVSPSWGSALREPPLGAGRPPSLTGATAPSA